MQLGKGTDLVGIIAGDSQQGWRTKGRSKDAYSGIGTGMEVDEEATKGPQKRRPWMSWEQHRTTVSYDFLVSNSPWKDFKAQGSGNETTNQPNRSYQRSRPAIEPRPQVTVKIRRLLEPKPSKTKGHCPTSSPECGSWVLANAEEVREDRGRFKTGTSQMDSLNIQVGTETAEGWLCKTLWAKCKTNGPSLAIIWLFAMRNSLSPSALPLVPKNIGSNAPALHSKAHIVDQRRARVHGQQQRRCCRDGRGMRGDQQPLSPKAVEPDQEAWADLDHRGLFSSPARAALW